MCLILTALRGRKRYSHRTGVPHQKLRENADSQSSGPAMGQAFPPPESSFLFTLSFVFCWLDVFMCFPVLSSKRENIRDKFYRKFLVISSWFWWNTKPVNKFSSLMKIT